MSDDSRPGDAADVIVLVSADPDTGEIWGLTEEGAHIIGHLPDGWRDDVEAT